MATECVTFFAIAAFWFGGTAQRSRTNRDSEGGFISKILKKWRERFSGEWTTVAEKRSDGAEQLLDEERVVEGATSRRHGGGDGGAVGI